MALILYRPAFWILAAALVLAVTWLARRFKLRWWPASLLRFGLLLLVLVGIFSPRGELTAETIPAREVMIVDHSDSLQPDALIQVQKLARAWQQAAPNRALVAFGKQPVVLLSESDEWPEIEGRATELLMAVQAGAQLLAGAPGRLILATDGVTPLPEAVQSALASLSEKHVQVELLPIETRSTAGDVYLGRISAPGYLWEGTPFEVSVPVLGASPDALPSLELNVNEKLVDAEPEAMDDGLVHFRIPALPQGISSIKIQVTAEGDPYLANNASYAMVQVFAPPRVLFVTANPERSVGFVDALKRAGIKVTSMAPEDLPTNIAALQNIEVIFLHDLLSSQLGSDKALTLQVFVARLGGGVIFLGGRNSYTLGDYKNTLLEPMLPVTLEPPPRPVRPPVAFLLVLDRSASMRDPASEGKTTIDLAREAAMRSIENLRADDYLGLLTYETAATWDIPIRRLGDGLQLRQAMDAVGQVAPSGGTRVYNALTIAVEALSQLSDDALETRHILLLSDGLSADGSPKEFDQVARLAAESGMTISTIALGPNADKELMQAIAETAQGRFYAAENPRDLPRIMLSESEATRSENIQLGRVSLEAGEQLHPILSGLSPTRLPALDGYLALTSKSALGAEDVLVSSSYQDPILSVWQYGLGRVTAWMGDLGEEWTGAWPASRDEGLFWSQVVRYSLPNPALQPVQVEIQVQDAGLLVNAYVQDESGDPVNLSDITFTYVSTEERAFQHTLSQVEPGVYRLQTGRPELGVYRAVVKTSSPSGQSTVTAVPFAVNAPLEWLPYAYSQGMDHLKQWAEAADGELVSMQDIFSPVKMPGTLARTTQKNRWWYFITTALVVLWPLEVAIRRRWLPWK